MDAPGAYFLLIGGTDFSVGAPGAYIGDWTDGLDGMLSASVQFDFRAGTTMDDGDVRAYLQTSLDGGNTIIDIACLYFTAADRRVVNIAASTTVEPVAVTDGAMSDDTVLDGILGDRLRVKIVSTGNWVNTYLGARMVVR